MISASFSKSDEDSIVDDATSAINESESEILEDSIIRDELQSDNHKIKNAERALEARNKGRFGITSSK